MPLFIIPLLLASMAVFAWFVLSLFNRPVEAIRRTKHGELLGPGGPDDPFADNRGGRR